MERKFKRGDIYYANLNPVIGSEQGGTRPVLIISNDVGNKHSPTVHCRTHHKPNTHQSKIADAYFKSMILKVWIRTQSFCLNR